MKGIDTQEVYNKLIQEVARLMNADTKAIEKSTVLENIITDYILSLISDKAVITILNKSKKEPKEVSLPDALFHSEVLFQTIKITGLMETSNNMEEFKNLANKRKAKPKKKELTDFDKILSGIMAVPKPDKKTAKK